MKKQTRTKAEEKRVLCEPKPRLYVTTKIF